MQIRSTGQIDYPATLERLDRWSTWKKAKRDDGTPFKLALKIDGWRAATSTDPDHFGTFDDACIKAGHATKIPEGLAFALFADDDVTCFDFDSVGSMTPEQQDAIRDLCKLSYSEESQSRNGIHIFFRGGDARILKKKFDWNGIKIEIYTCKRWMAVTGLGVEGSPPDLCAYDADAIEKILGDLPMIARENTDAIDDDAISEAPTMPTAKILKAIKRSWDKDSRFVWSVLRDGGSNDSDADNVFCKTLFRHGAVYSQALEIVLDNNLRTDDKWDREDYQLSTLSRAMADEAKDQARRVDMFEAVHTKNHKDLYELDEERQTELRRRIEELGGMVAQFNKKKSKKLRAEIDALSKSINEDDIKRLNCLCGVVITDNTRVYATHEAGALRLFKQIDFMPALEEQRYHTKVKVSKGGGELTIVASESADAWRKSSGKIKFPGKPGMMPSPDHLNKGVGFTAEDATKPFNLFKGVGFKAQGKKSDCKLIRKHILNVWANGNKEVCEYLHDWLARMVQLPHLQGETAIVLQSSPGAGKNIIPDNIFAPYYMDHYTITDNTEDIKGFNKGPSQSVMLIFDEADFKNSKKAQQALKRYCTAPDIPSEEKYEAKMTIRNCTHIMFLTNDKWSVPVEIGDRRYVILKCSDKRIGDHDYFDTLLEEIENGGREAFIKYLLKRKIENFSPRKIPQAAHNNEARQSNVEYSLSPFKRWLMLKPEQGVFSAESNDTISWDDGAPLKIAYNDLRESFIWESRKGGLPNPQAHYPVTSALAAEITEVFPRAETGQKNIVHTFVESSDIKRKGRGVLFPNPGEALNDALKIRDEG